MLDKMQRLTDIDISMLSKIQFSVLCIMGFWLLSRIALRAVWAKTENVNMRYIWRKVINYSSFFLALIMLVGIWMDGMTGVGTFLGLLSAGVAVALRDPLSCIGGWVFLMVRRPFRVGDRVQIGGMQGDVIDISIFQFSILEIGNWVQADQSTGRILEVPNGRVFTDSIANYTVGFPYIWNEIPVLVTFESDWRKAKTILSKIAEEKAISLSAEAERKIKEASRQFMIFYSKLTPIVYTTVEASGVLLTIRYMCKPQQRRGTTEEMWECILDAFAEEPTIDFAYPTQRFYDLSREGQLPSSPIVADPHKL